MKPKKVGRYWVIDEKKIDSYELYAVFASSKVFQDRHGKIVPSQFTPELVEEYLEAKRNKLPPFEDKRTGILWNHLTETTK